MNDDFWGGGYSSLDELSYVQLLIIFKGLNDSLFFNFYIFIYLVLGLH